uniref:G-protein coupled receptors family 1 profile domain-containing protein n=1 Tax=Callorhinchus milii TaxID=7868 RepID=A0A4W3GG37_CALMI
KVLSSPHMYVMLLKCPSPPLALTHFFSYLNLLTILILSRGKCGLSNCITRYLVAMAAADLSVIVSEVILKQIGDIYLDTSYLFYTPVCSFIHVISAAAVDSAVWLTVAFTFDRFVALCCQKLKQKYCTEKTASVVIGTLSALLCLENIPFYFTFHRYRNIHNLPWGCLVKPNLLYHAAWITFYWLEQILVPLFPFVLILLLNALTVRHILVASRVRTRLRGSSSSKSIILLFTISLSFILLWVTSVAHYIQYRVKGFYKSRGFFNPLRMFEEAGFMLQLLSCCTNTAIYSVTQTKFREELKNLIKICVVSYHGSVKCSHLHPFKSVPVVVIRNVKTFNYCFN